MENLLIAGKIKDIVGNSRVKAALFYTFNFDPDFFENYVMPLLITDNAVHFSDNKLQNIITWRRCNKNNQIPPITVYCDQKVKNINHGPQLAYDIVSLKLKTHFHTKQSFILTNDKRLIVLTGSNNLSFSGWCENRESISIVTLQPDMFYPEEFKNEIKNFIRNISRLNSSKSSYSVAESKILSFLQGSKHTKREMIYYNSLERIEKKQGIEESGFRKFFKDHVLADNNEIEWIEIISPFYSPDTKLIDFLITKRIKKISCLVPYHRQNFVELEESVFRRYCDKKVIWCDWDNTIKDFERYNHSKVYRIKGRHSFIILGSVNFTEMAWNHFNHNGNIESAVLYRVKGELAPVLKKTNENRLNFIEAYQDTEENRIDDNGNIPDLLFEIDWLENTLKYYNRTKKTWYLNLLDQTDQIIQSNPVKVIQLSSLQRKLLADNTIIHITDYKKQQNHYYYPQQLNSEQKPLPSKIKFSEKNILGFWNELHDADLHDLNYNKRLDEVIESNTSPDDGEPIVNINSLEVSTLNIMALHLTGLTNLEHTLFGNKLSEENIRYYLTEDNIDTVPFYLNHLKENFISGQLRLNNGFLWFILNLVQKKLYQNKKLKQLQISLTNQSKEIKHFIKIVSDTLNGISKKHRQWLLSKI